MMVLAYGFAALYLLWLFFLAVMRLKETRDAGKLTLVAKVLGAPILYAGWALDIAVNWCVMTVLLLEFPHETTVTARLKRHKQGDGWRKAFAVWMGDNLLDPYDPSGHHL